MKQLAIVLVLAALPLPAAAQDVSDVSVTITTGLKAAVRWTGRVGGGHVDVYELAWATYDLNLENFPLATHASYTNDVNNPTLYKATIALPEWDRAYYFGIYCRFDNSLVVVSASTPSEPDAVPPDGTTLSASSVSGSILLSWTAPGDDGPTGRATRYDLRYSTSGPVTAATWNDPGTVPVVGAPAPSMAGTLEAMELQNLPPGLDYHFAVKTADEASNWSSILPGVSVLLVADLTPPGDAVLEVEGVGADWVILGWTAPGDDGLDGIAARYELRYSLAGDGDFAAATPLVDLPMPAQAGTRQGLRVAGLTPHTPVWFALRTSDEGARWSDVSTAATETLHVVGSFGNSQACSSRGAATPLVLLALLLAAGIVRR